jgi:hypothetical protein
MRGGGERRLRCRHLHRGILRISLATFSKLYLPEEDRRSRMRRTSRRGRLPGRAPSNTGEARQAVATEVWMLRGCQALASAMKRSKRAREAGLRS